MTGVNDVVFVGMLADIPPYVPSVKRECDKCGRDLWVDRKLTQVADAAAKRLCFSCATLDFSAN